MSHLGILGVHVELILFVARHLDWLTANDLESETIETFYLGRIIGHKDKFVDAEVSKDRCSGAVFSQISSITQRQIGFHSVHALILQTIRLEFVNQTDATTFLTKVKQHATTTLLDAAHSLGQLFATVATQAAEGIACEAF